MIQFNYRVIQKVSDLSQIWASVIYFLVSLTVDNRIGKAFNIKKSVFDYLQTQLFVQFIFAVFSHLWAL